MALKYGKKKTTVKRIQPKRVAEKQQIVEHNKKFRILSVQEKVNELTQPSLTD